MDVLVVINPVAGGGRARADARRLMAILTRRGHRVDAVETSHGDIPGLRERLHAGAPDVIVAAGGDGTVSMLANKLPDRGAFKVAHLPAGSANQLARELGLTGEPGDAAALIERGSVLRMDTGAINGKRFLFNVSAGFDALVCREIARAPRSTLGYGGYVLPALRAHTRYRAPKLSVSVDGKDTATGGYVLVANIKNYGGLFPVAHRASPTDGLLDVVILSEGSRRSLIRLALYAAAKRVSKLPGVTYLTGRHVKITSKKPCPVQADGEFFGETPVEIEMGKGCISILVPPPP